MDHTASHREVLAANLARVTAARRQAVVHGHAHTTRVRRRHDDLTAEIEALEAQIGDDPRRWHPDDLHELDTLQRERGELARMLED